MTAICQALQKFFVSAPKALINSEFFSLCWCYFIIHIFIYIMTLWLWGEQPSGLRRCYQNQKVPSSNPTRHLAGLKDQTSLEGYWCLQVKYVNMQWLTVGEWGYPLDNGLKLAVEQRNKQLKKDFCHKIFPHTPLMAAICLGSNQKNVWFTSTAHP